MVAGAFKKRRVSFTLLFYKVPHILQLLACTIYANNCAALRRLFFWFRTIKVNDDETMKMHASNEIFTHFSFVLDAIQRNDFFFLILLLHMTSEGYIRLKVFDVGHTDKHTFFCWPFVGEVLLLFFFSLLT